MALKLTKAERLIIIISISFSFFLAEIGVGFYTRSLALVADAFHYLNDLVGFIVALVSFKISERATAPKELSFGWQRATLLGAFFNGVFLLALGVSIFLQSIERFVSLEEVQNPKLVLIIGCVGLILNVISASFVHEHDEAVVKAAEADIASLEGGVRSCEHIVNHNEHRHEIRLDQATTKSMDFGLMGVFIHVLGDAANNIGVIIAAIVIWKADYPGRFYADPAVSMAIAFMVFFSSIPLVRRTGEVLMESSPVGVDPDDVKHDIEMISGVVAVHELHIWRLNQRKSLASAHIVVSDAAIYNFVQIARTVTECLHAYGIHSATLQPELILNGDRTRRGIECSTDTDDYQHVAVEGLRQRVENTSVCGIRCDTGDCLDLVCCS